MLIKKGDLVKSTILGWTGIVTKVDSKSVCEIIIPNVLNSIATCEVQWMLNSSSVGLTKTSQRRWENIANLEILSGKKKAL